MDAILPSIVCNFNKLSTDIRDTIFEYINIGNYLSDKELALTLLVDFKVVPYNLRNRLLLILARNLSRRLSYERLEQGEKLSAIVLYHFKELQKSTRNTILEELLPKKFIRPVLFGILFKPLDDLGDRLSLGVYKNAKDSYLKYMDRVYPTLNKIIEAYADDLPATLLAKLQYLPNVS